MIEIDGSFKEGGGAILRTALALSVITGKSCRIFNIRKKRKQPGVKTQHLSSIKALSQLCGGKVEGDFLNSEEVKFYPAESYQNQITVEMETAGSITLILQALLPPSLFAPFPIKVIFKGGATDTFFSPTIDYYRYVFLPMVEKFGVKAEINILKRGYYPEGGARVEVKFFPSKLKNINLTKRGKLQKILIISGASELLKNKKVAERQLAGTKEILGKLKLPVEERVEYYQTSCPGSQICLIAYFENTIIGSDNLGKLGKKAELVGKEAALEILKEGRQNGCLDSHFADQILPYLALAKGTSEITVSKITKHCQTNIWVIEKFINGKFKVKDNLISWLPLTS